jgi:hypothetical protein
VTSTLKAARIFRVVGVVIRFVQHFALGEELCLQGPCHISHTLKASLKSVLNYKVLWSSEPAPGRSCSLSFSSLRVDCVLCNSLCFSLRKGNAFYSSS